MSPSALLPPAESAALQVCWPQAALALAGGHQRHGRPSPAAQGALPRCGGEPVSGPWQMQVLCPPEAALEEPPLSPGAPTVSTFSPLH